MEKNVMSLIQQQAEKIFSTQTNSSPNVNVVPSLNFDRVVFALPLPSSDVTTVELYPPPLPEPELPSTPP